MHMVRQFRRPALTVAAVSIALAPVGVLVQPVQAAVQLERGDVLAGVGNSTIRVFSPAGTLKGTLTTGSAEFNTGMCFDSQGNLYVTQFHGGMSKFDRQGNLLTGNFGSGFNEDPESCTVNKLDQIYVGQADGSGDVLKFSSSGALLRTYNPARENRGTDFIDLAADQKTLFYTSEGSSIKRFNVSTNSQLPNFASGLPGPCLQVRIRPNGQVLVACADAVKLLSASGAVIQTYAPAHTSQLFALTLDPDGTSFWTGDYDDGQVFHIDIASGNVLKIFNAARNTGLFGLAVVGEIQVGRGDGNSPQCTITGTNGDNFLVGTTGRDVLCGRGGNDTIDARAGGDVVRGGDGNDFIIGRSGADKLYGDAGNDDIDAVDGSGGDTVYGGAGRDVCRIDPGDRAFGCEVVTGAPAV